MVYERILTSAGTFRLVYGRCTLVRSPYLQYLHASNSSLNYMDNFKMTRCFHAKTAVLYKDPESKAEKTVNLLKENILDLKNPAEQQKPLQEIKKVKTEIKVEQMLGSVKLDEEKPAEPKIEVSKITEVKTQTVTTTTTTTGAGTVATTDAQQLPVDVKRLTLWQKIVNECKHYYHGFKLLYFETKIAYGLMKKVLRGDTLTRRERKQFTRTVADLFRLVPFSVFIIVPFMEFTLPIFLKLFPNMLPSTFQEQSKEQEKLKKRLKAKLEMAKFLQDTLEETALKAESNDNSESVKLNQKFAEFMKKIRSKGEQPSNEEILKYSSLFENELTLDNLTRQQLIALCQILEISTLGNIPPNHILRFQLRMRIRNLEADDQMILKEGIETLTIDELQMACRERGMRAIGLSRQRLKTQLEQWLDLHISRKIPTSLLLLSRALYLPENLPAEDLIKTTISALPQSIEDATLLKVTEASGDNVDNKTKLELLKQEQAQIRLENDAKIESEMAKAPPAIKPIESPVPSLKPEPVSTGTVPVEKVFGAEQLAKEQLIDKAPILSTAPASEVHEIITPVEIKEINQIIENLPVSSSKQVKAEIDELKKDISEYNEDVKEIEQSLTTSKTKLTETKSAKLLSKRVNKLLSDMDSLMARIEKENVSSKDIHQPNAVSIDELIETIKRFKGISNQTKEKKLVQILQTLDKDKDGKIDDLNDVLKVFDLIEQENVQVNKDQLSKILNLLEKEKLIELEEQHTKNQTTSSGEIKKSANS